MASAQITPALLGSTSMLSEAKAREKVTVVKPSEVSTPASVMASMPSGTMSTTWYPTMR